MEPKIKELNEDERKAIQKAAEVFIRGSLKMGNKVAYVTRRKIIERVEHKCPFDISYSIDPERDDYDDYPERLVSKEVAYNIILSELEAKGELEKILVEDSVLVQPSQHYAYRLKVP